MANGLIPKLRFGALLNDLKKGIGKNKGTKNKASKLRRKYINHKRESYPPGRRTRLSVA